MSIEALAKALTAAVGTNDAETEVKHWLDTGFKPLNLIVSGDYNKGLPQGRIVEIFGPSASGKTLIATQAMIAAQRAGGIAMFVDWECSFNADFAREMGLNTEFPHFVYKRAETWEQGNTDAMKVAEAIRKSKAIRDDAPVVVVFDSIAAAVPKSMIEKGIDEYTMNDTTALARVTSTTLKAINQYVGRYGVTAIYLNQIRLKPGVVYGDPTTTPGGSAMEFYASVRLGIGAKKIMDKSGGDKEFVGRLIGITTKKNKLNRPFQEVELRLVYGEGGRAKFDYAGSLLEHLIEKGVLSETGGRVTWTDGKTYFRKQLVERIEKEGLYPELEAMLSKVAA